jgi:hypothetical protein
LPAVPLVVEAGADVGEVDEVGDVDEVSGADEVDGVMVRPTSSSVAARLRHMVRASTEALISSSRRS